MIDPAQKLHLSISLLELAVLEKKDAKCSACLEPLDEEGDTHAVGVYFPSIDPMYFHDDTCFDKVIQGLDRFNRLRPSFRDDPKPNLVN